LLRELAALGLSGQRTRPGFSVNAMLSFVVQRRPLGTTLGERP